MIRDRFTMEAVYHALPEKKKINLKFVILLDLNLNARHVMNGLLNMDFRKNKIERWNPLNYFS